MAKYKIEWSIEARLDLIDVLEFYIERNGSAGYSKKLFSKINNCVLLIKNNPFIGLKTNFESVRAFVTGDFQIIYEVFENTILIVMVWDSRRNPETKNTLLTKRK